ncbi:hypothetical protein [Actinomadura craniellae]|nr:hypothetical protein [Actinomadura craniellae]
METAVQWVRTSWTKRSRGGATDIRVFLGDPTHHVSELGSLR